MRNHRWTQVGLIIAPMLWWAVGTTGCLYAFDAEKRGEARPWRCSSVGDCLDGYACVKDEQELGVCQPQEPGAENAPSCSSVSECGQNQLCVEMRSSEGESQARCVNSSIYRPACGEEMTCGSGLVCTNGTCAVPVDEGGGSGTGVGGGTVNSRCGSVEFPDHACSKNEDCGNGMLCAPELDAATHNQGESGGCVPFVGPDSGATFTTISAALAASRSNGQCFPENAPHRIIVRGGEYAEEGTLELHDNVQLYGGFPGAYFDASAEASLATNTNWRKTSERVVIKTNAEGPVIKILSNAKNIVLDGFFIKGTVQSTGGVVIERNVCTPGSQDDSCEQPLIRQTAFLFHRSDVNTGGAALHITGASPNIYQSVFMANYAQNAGVDVSEGGGAVYAGPGSNPLFANTAFVANRAKGKGGAMYVKGDAKVTLLYTTFTANHCEANDCLSSHAIFSEAENAVWAFSTIFYEYDFIADDTVGDSMGLGCVTESHESASCHQMLDGPKARNVTSTLVEDRGLLQGIGFPFASDYRGKSFERNIVDPLQALPWVEGDWWCSEEEYSWGDGCGSLLPKLSCAQSVGLLDDGFPHPDPMPVEQSMYESDLLGGDRIVDGKYGTGAIRQCLLP